MFDALASGEGQGEGTGEGVEGAERPALANLPPSLVPGLLRALLPCQSKIVAAALGLSVELVAEQMPLGKKAEALRLVLQAEAMPALLAWQKRQPPPKPPRPKRPPRPGEAREAEAEPLTRAGLYELFSSEYGWTPGQVAGMSFLMQNLYLTRLVARRKREAGVEEEPEPKLISGKELAAFFS